MRRLARARPRGPARRRPPARRPVRTHLGEGGFTLLEMMISVAIAGAIVVPVLAWMTLGFTQQDQLMRRSHDDTATDFLAAYVPRDVASATAATVGGVPCGSAPIGTDSTVILTLTGADFGSGATRTVYSISEAPGTVTASGIVTPPTGSLWRRRCPIDPAGTPTDELQLTDRLVKPTAGWTSLVSCSVRPGYATDDPCAQITLIINGLSRAPSTITAALRSGPAR